MLSLLFKEVKVSFEWNNFSFSHLGSLSDLLEFGRCDFELSLILHPLEFPGPEQWLLLLFEMLQLGNLLIRWNGSIVGNSINVVTNVSVLHDGTAHRLIPLKVLPFIQIYLHSWILHQSLRRRLSTAYSWWSRNCWAKFRRTLTHGFWGQGMNRNWSLFFLRWIKIKHFYLLFTNYTTI